MYSTISLGTPNDVLRNPVWETLVEKTGAAFSSLHTLAHWISNHLSTPCPHVSSENYFNTKRVLSYKFLSVLRRAAVFNIYTFPLTVFLQMIVFHSGVKRMLLIHSSIHPLSWGKGPTDGPEPSRDDNHYQRAAFIIRTLWHSLHMQYFISHSKYKLLLVFVLSQDSLFVTARVNIQPRNNSYQNLWKYV
jgi:hypothetical protein